MFLHPEAWAFQRTVAAITQCWELVGSSKHWEAAGRDWIAPRQTVNPCGRFLIRAAEPNPLAVYFSAIEKPVLLRLFLFVFFSILFLSLRTLPWYLLGTKSNRFREFLLANNRFLSELAYGASLPSRIIRSGTLPSAAMRRRLITALLKFCIAVDTPSREDEVFIFDVIKFRPAGHPSTSPLLLCHSREDGLTWFITASKSSFSSLSNHRLTAASHRPRRPPNTSRVPHIGHRIDYLEFRSRSRKDPGFSAP